MATPNIEELIERLYDWHNTSAEQNRLDMQKAADLLQSQAERIKGLEAEIRHKAPVIATWRDKHDTLRAQIAAIAATEPVAVRHSFDGYGWSFIDNGSGSTWRERGMAKAHAELLFTRPMPAQDVTDSHLHTLNVLKNVKQCLEAANKMGESSPICDTIWFTPHETLFDYIDAALSKYKGT